MMFIWIHTFIIGCALGVILGGLLMYMLFRKFYKPNLMYNIRRIIKNYV